MTKENRLALLMLLAKQHGTDKLGHGYIPYYANHLPEKCNSFLEIGVLKGASARMFDDLYGNNLDFHLVDLFGEEGNLTPRQARNLGFIPHKGSQTDITFLSTIPIKFDVIVEDASHNSWDQVVTFKHAITSMLQPGGLYIVEDLHCCKDPFYWNGNITCLEDTLLHFLNKGEFYESKNFNAGEAEVFNSLIKNISVYDDKIAFITIHD